MGQRHARFSFGSDSSSPDTSVVQYLCASSPAAWIDYVSVCCLSLNTGIKQKKHGVEGRPRDCIRALGLLLDEVRFRTLEESSFCRAADRVFPDIFAGGGQRDHFRTLTF